MPEILKFSDLSISLDSHLSTQEQLHQGFSLGPTNQSSLSSLLPNSSLSSNTPGSSVRTAFTLTVSSQSSYGDNAQVPFDPLYLLFIIYPGSSQGLLTF